MSAWLPASFAVGQVYSVLAGSSGKQPEICRVFDLEKEALSPLWLQLPEAFWRHETVSELVLLWRSETPTDSQVWGFPQAFTTLAWGLAALFL